MNKSIQNIFIFNKNSIKFQTNLPINIITQVNENNLSNYNNLTLYCKYFCTNNYIANLLTNINIWNYIVSNNLTNVLVINNNYSTITNFDEIYNNNIYYLDDNFDILFFKQYQNPKNKIIHKYNNYNFDNYLITNNCAKKLIEYFNNNKIDSVINIKLNSYMFNLPMVLKINNSSNNLNYHPVLSRYINLDCNIFHFRLLDYDFSLFLLVLCILGFFIALIFKYNYAAFYLNLIIFFYLGELIIGTRFNDLYLIRALLIEIIFIIIFIYGGLFVNNNLL